MPRYIDADALIEDFMKDTPYGCGTVGIKFVDDLIKAQPTAYDVDAVVAELEKEKDMHTHFYGLSEYKEFPEVKTRYELIMYNLDKAIDIVRNAGKDGAE